MEFKNNNYLVTDLQTEIDIDFIVTSLQATYWAFDRTKESILASLKNSVMLSLFEKNKQIGFARIVGDGATFAWICDVYIDESCRGKGLGTFLMTCVMEHPSTQVKNCVLGTKDAHTLYEKFGFKRCELMRKRNTTK